MACAQEAIERLRAVQARAEQSAAGLGYYEASMLLGKAYAGWPQHLGEALDVYGSLTEKFPEDFRCGCRPVRVCWPYCRCPGLGGQSIPLLLRQGC